MKNVEAVLEWPVIDFDFDTRAPDIVNIDLRIDEKSIDALLDEIELEYPHVSERLSLLIGTVEFDLAMNCYVFNSKGTRQGFPKHILSCLLKISQLHTERYGSLLVINDPWHSNF